MNQHHFFTTCIWDALNVNASQTKSSWMNTEKCTNHEFLLEQMKNYQGGKRLTQTRSRGQTIWKDNAQKWVERYCELANKKTEQFYKVSSPCLDMITISRKRNWNQLQTCHRYAHKFSWHACTWHELVDLTFFCQWTKLARSVTKWTSACDRRLARLISYVHQVTTDNTVMWETRLSIVDWVCSKTQILLATLGTENQPRERTYVSSEVEYSSASFGCARNKRQCLTVLQSLKSFRWMLDCVWMGYLLLIFGTSWLKYYVQPTTLSNPKHTSHQETGAVLDFKTKTQHVTRRQNSIEWGGLWTHQHILLNASLSCTSLKKTNLWSRWSSNDEVRRWDTCLEPTELRLIGCSTESTWNQRSKSSMLTPKTNSRTCWPKVILHVMSGTIFFDCWT